MDIVDMILSIAIPLVSTVIGGTVVMKLAKNSLKTELLNYIGTEDGAKMLYAIGALLGNGAKAGLGFNIKGGKFKWQDLLGEIAGGFIKKTLGIQEEGAPQEEQQKQGFKLP